MSTITCNEFPETHNQIGMELVVEQTKYKPLDLAMTRENTWAASNVIHGTRLLMDMDENQIARFDVGHVSTAIAIHYILSKNPHYTQLYDWVWTRSTIRHEPTSKYVLWAKKKTG